jgi:Type VI secretion system, VipA, VC_A0107 or Hcp2
MAKLVQDNIGAQEQDGIKAEVGMQYLRPNGTVLLLPLQDDCPTDPEEMVVEGEPTYSIGNMFKALDPSIEVSLSTGDDKNPMQDETIHFPSIKGFEPETIMDNVPLLREMKDKKNLIDRIEQLMKEEAFKKILKDRTKKEAIINFLRSVIADIEAREEED